MTYTEIEESNIAPNALPISERIVFKIIQELYGRAAFDHWWDNIEDEDRDELFDTLKEITGNELQKL
jgi:hypothetical protein